MTRLEDMVRAHQTEDVTTLVDWVGHLEGQTDSLKAALVRFMEDIEARFSAMTDKLISFVDSTKANLKKEDKMALIKMVLNGSSTMNSKAQKIKVPKPK